MKANLKIIAISVLFSVLSSIGVYRYAPLAVLEGDQKAPILGSTITTINGSDRISDSRAVINTNFANLNADKIETSTTTLPNITSLLNLASIGTITTGTWNATTIGVPYGGTGSTSLSQYSILLGSTTNAVGIVSGLGTSGQFLTSSGAGAPPTWTTSSIDQTASYNFTGSTFRVKNLYASSTLANPIVLNGVSFYTSGTQGASSTVLTNNGSGGMFWVAPDWKLIESTTTAGAMTAATTTSIAAYSDVLVYYYSPSKPTAESIRIQFSGDSATNYGYKEIVNGVLGDNDSNVTDLAIGSATTSESFLTMHIKNNVTQRKYVQFRISESSGTGAAPGDIDGSGVWNNTSAAITTIQFVAGSGSARIPAGTIISIYGR